MEILEKEDVSPPGDETTYTIKVIDHGQGNNKLDVAPGGDPSQAFSFTITNDQLYECQWRSTTETLPTPILRAVEYYGYHVTDVTRRPTHGLRENVQYLRETAEEIHDDLHDENIPGQAGVNWVVESLGALEKLELLRAHLTATEYQMVMWKANETSKNHPSGNLTVPTSTGPTDASLKSLVTLMLAYAQHDGVLDRALIDPDIVDNLVQEAPYA